MSGAKSTGLARAAELYSVRGQRARELKQEGKKIFGYFCCYPPIEIMTALDIVPVRILGNMDEPITIADGYLPPVMCVFCRSAFDIGMKKSYDYFDGFVGAHACDGAERTALIWTNYIKTPCNFHLDIPHTAHNSAVDFFKQQIAYFQQAVEKFIGQKISPEALKDAVARHNRQRALVRDLYDLRKPDPPLISGSEMLQVLIALMCIPVEEGNVLLEEVIQEVRERPNVQAKKSRLLIWGSLIDNTAFTDLIESSGLNIVVEDTAIGTRPFWHDIEETQDPLDGIAEHYLKEVLCPRTFRDSGPSYQEDSEMRFGYLKEFAKYWKVDGVFANIIRNCDVHGYEVPVIKDYFAGLGLPVLVIEQDYSTAALETLRTRFQAFAETIG
ncbi:MAG: 2-hydroxyacyl-CoA dehydratase [Desulfobacterales bacterium]|nr:MAG: 2-hydroxyacyl-CoA dehydratase [Desulfobacterales bacterium]